MAAADDAFEAWILASLANGQVARAGPGTFRLARTHAFTLQGQHLVMTGAGTGRTLFRRAPDSVHRNAEVLMRFVGIGAGAAVEMSGLALDMNCDQQPAPPGAVALAGNFAWQHCGIVEFLPQSPGAFRLIKISDCEIRNPIADGFSIRGGPAPGVGNAIFERVVNRLWPLDQKRPRVRGDITITSLIELVTVSDCILPRLHYEPEGPMPPGKVMNIVERNNRTGEIIVYFHGSYAVPERARRSVSGGSVERSVNQGNCSTIIRNASFTMRRPSRLTGGPHRFESCRFLVASDYDPGKGAPTALFASSYPVASSIEIIGGRLEVAPGAQAPGSFINRQGEGSPPGRILIDGLVDLAPAIELATGSITQITLRNIKRAAPPSR